MTIAWALALAFAAPAVAQTQAAPTTPAPATADDDSQPNDIVVEGYRLSKSPDSRTRPPAMVSSVAIRQKYEFSERIARCAGRNKFGTLRRLRAVVDGEFNSANHRHAQDALVRTYVTCSQSPSLLSLTSAPRDASSAGDAINAALGGDFKTTGVAPDAFPLGLSIYDRGAFTIEALKRFAPDLRLTSRQVNDPAVQARFDLREIPRNRFRLPLDHDYFEVAVCMVRVEPRLAVRLAMSDGPAKLGDVQEALIDRARICVGGAKRVQVDSTQFRLYIADAVYRWAVAAKNVDSLIPKA